MKTIVKLLILILSLALTGALLAACQTGPSKPAEPPFSGNSLKLLTADVFSSSRVQTKVSDEFRRGYAKLAVDLLKTCANGGTALVSPLSVLTALQMTANGAGGTTAEEMRNVLCGMETEELNKQLFNYYEGLVNTENAGLKAANAVWIADWAEQLVRKEYLETIDNTFRAQVAAAPFTDPATIDAINDWCSYQTDGMIPKILERDFADEQTVMILLNALCFDGKWSEGYSSGDCENETFHGANGDRTVRMMYCDGDGYLYGSDETGFIKYYDGKYAFVALLPNRNMSLEKYLNSLNGDRFLSLLTIRSGTVRTGLPKFESDWSGSLIPALTELGMNAAFGDGADFSGMADLDTLKIGSVIHKTHIEVDESGTKAAAATAVGMKYESAPSSGPDYVVVLDRPFVYAIIDTEAKLPVFIGSIADIS